MLYPWRVPEICRYCDHWNGCTDETEAKCDVQKDIEFGYRLIKKAEENCDRWTKTKSLWKMPKEYRESTTGVRPGE